MRAESIRGRLRGTTIWIVTAVTAAGSAALSGGVFAGGPADGTPRALLRGSLAGAAPAAQAQEALAAERMPLRRVETRSGSIRLDIATRTFQPAEGDGPAIGLVAVAHLADESFFREIDDLLEEYDLVLYEAVRPDGAGRPTGRTDLARVESTARSLRFLAGVIESYRAGEGRYPEDLSALERFAAGRDALLLNWVRQASRDAWDRPLKYDTDPSGIGYTLHSPGPEDAEETEAAGDDRLLVTDRDGIEPLQLEKDGLQQQLADALGLAFQLRSLPYDRPNWRPSDMTIGELAVAFRARGSEFAPMESTLAGTSLPAALGRMLLGMISMLDTMSEGAVSDMLKVLLIDMLSDEQVLEMGLEGLGRDVAAVLIDDRNQVVVEDLKRIIGEEPEVGSIAVLYGAAHMPDLAERLADQLAYEADDSPRWLAAIEVDLRRSRLDPRTLQQLRLMMRRAMELP